MAQQQHSVLIQIVPWVLPPVQIACLSVFSKSIHTKRQLQYVLLQLDEEVDILLKLTRRTRLRKVNQEGCMEEVMKEFI